MTTSKNSVDQIAANMVFVEGGTYGMAEDQSHQVTIKDFYLCRYPVTVKAYLAFVEATNSNPPEWMEEGSRYNIYTGSNDRYKKLGPAITNENHPIVGVSWNNAVAYCKWLSEETGQPYRLPSEAEWEYAARGGKHKSPYRYSGSNNLKEVGWYRQNSHRETKPVGQKLSNTLGLFDMSGNVREWCADKWQEDLAKIPRDGSPAKGDAKTSVIRGGSWNLDVYSCTVWGRNRYDSDYRFNFVGFRVCRY